MPGRPRTSRLRFGRHGVVRRAVRARADAHRIGTPHHAVAPTDGGDRCGHGGRPTDRQTEPAMDDRSDVGPGAGGAGGNARRSRLRSARVRSAGAAAACAGGGRHLPSHPDLHRSTREHLAVLAGPAAAVAHRLLRRHRSAGVDPVRRRDPRRPVDGGRVAPAECRVHGDRARRRYVDRPAQASQCPQCGSESSPPGTCETSPTRC